MSSVVAGVDAEGMGVGAIPGMGALWGRTRGDRRVLIAVIDGPIDLQHAAFRDASIEVFGGGIERVGAGPACAHGTAIGGLIFGGGMVEGVAPGCRGLWFPVLRDVGGGNGELVGCSQMDLARAMDLAVVRGASVINVSAGQFAPGGGAHPVLARAVRRAVEAGVIVVAAAGNDGCACLHVPASEGGVVVVGALGQDGEPLAASNFGAGYAGRGVTAPGAGLSTARCGGGQTQLWGTSAAAAVVSGTVGLLLSGWRVRGGFERRKFVAFFLDTLDGRAEDRPVTRRNPRSLRSRLSIPKLLDAMDREWGDAMSSELSGVDVGCQADALSVGEIGGMEVAAGGVVARGVEASGCGCGGGGGARVVVASPLVFALGALDYDLVSEARRDWFRAALGTSRTPDRAEDLLGHLKEHPWDAPAVHWVLKLDQTPIYALEPFGPYAQHLYEHIVEAFSEQVGGEVERVSIAGRVVGEARLSTGQVLPTVRPELRGFYSWNTSALVKAVCDHEGKKKGSKDDEETREGVKGFLDRVYYELRNIGMSPQDRALNFAATNALTAVPIYERRFKDGMELDTIQIHRSPVCRPESDCWDIEATFFYPGKPQPAIRKVHRFTVDVSDVVPVMVGGVREWSVR